MTVDLSGASGRLSELWGELKPDYNLWSFQSISYLKERFGTDLESDHEARLLSSRILFGRDSSRMMDGSRKDSEFEEDIGELIAIAIGVVFLRADWRIWTDYGGLMRREPRRETYQNKLRFSVYSATNVAGRVLVEENDDGTATIEHSDGEGSSTITIGAERWVELKQWLDQWLPESDEEES